MMSIKKNGPKQCRKSGEPGCPGGHSPVPEKMSLHLRRKDQLLMKKQLLPALKLLASGVFFIALGLAPTSTSACQLQYTGKAASMFGSAPRGSFNSLEECENYQRSSPGFERTNSRCVNCSSSSAGGGYSDYSSSGNFQQQIFMGLMDSFIRGFNQGMSRPPSGPSPQQQALLKQQQKKRQEEYRARRREQIKKFQQEYNRLAAAKFERNRNDLLADFKLRYAATIGKNETIKAIEELNCSAYWGMEAAGMALAGRDEFARVYGEYSARAKTDDSLSGKCPAISVEIPPVGAPQPATFQKDFYRFIVKKTADLLPVIHDLKEQKKKSAHIVAAKKKEIKNLEENRASRQGEKEIDDVDALLDDAYKALNEAMEQDEKAEAGLKEAEKKLTALKEMRGIYDLADADDKKDE